MKLGGLHLKWTSFESLWWCSFLYVFIWLGKTNLNTASLRLRSDIPKRKPQSPKITWIDVLGPSLPYHLKHCCWYTPPKSNIDTKNDGLKHSSNMASFWVSIHSFSFWSPGVVVGTPTVGARGHRLEKTWVDTLQLEKDFKYFSGTISCMSRFLYRIFISNLMMSCEESRFRKCVSKNKNDDSPF